MENIAQRITAAFASTNDLPSPEYAPAATPTDKVLGRASPISQALFVLSNEIYAEHMEAKRKFTGTAACSVSCPCSGLRRQYTVVRDLLNLFLREEIGVAYSVPCDIRADWVIIEGKRTPFDGLPPGLADLLRAAGLGDLDIAGSGVRRGNVQEV